MIAPLSFEGAIIKAQHGLIAIPDSEAFLTKMNTDLRGGYALLSGGDGKGGCRATHAAMIEETLKGNLPNRLSATV
jgi:hypothetical protein